MAKKKATKRKRSKRNDRRSEISVPPEVQRMGDDAIGAWLEFEKGLDRYATDYEAKLREHLDALNELRHERHRDGAELAVVMTKKKPTKKAKASRPKKTKRGERVLLFLVKPGELTAKEIYEISRKAIDEHLAKRRARRGTRRKGKRAGGD